jgi:organic radical activating enzyme
MRATAVERAYAVNEVFYSLQGEGVRAGTANVFVRFAGCNLTCSKDGEAGFDCDTEFLSGRKLSLGGLHAEVLGAIEREAGHEESTPARWIIFTGGEPGLQVDVALVDFMHKVGFSLAIESNGTISLPSGLDWVCVSPKSAEHTIRQETCDEVKYVRNYGQGIPRPRIAATHKLISPAFRTLHSPNGPIHEPEPGAMEWCVKLVKENPEWRLSVQQHKQWKVR